MLIDVTDSEHPCEALAEQIMEKSGAGGLVVVILRRNQPAESIVMLPDIPGACRAAGVILRDLADRVDAQARELERATVPVGNA